MDVSGNTIHADFFPFSTDQLDTTDPYFAVAKAKGKERKKKIKSLTKSLDNLHVEVV
ncbi:hypothetical protein Tco_0619074, partial [Tanacetum coccineum]